MVSRSHKRIYVFEKEPQFRTMLETAMISDEASISGFCRHQECVERFDAKPCDLLILDFGGCEPQGLYVLERVRRIAPWISSLAIVEHADVFWAIKAVKAGAGDCLDKPVEREQLLAAVGAQLARVEALTRHRTRDLTRMEIQIVQLILAGKTSCAMAAEFHRSRRTIEAHRKNIMRKLHVTSLVDFIKRALEMGFGDQPEQAPDAR